MKFNSNIRFILSVLTLILFCSCSGGGASNSKVADKDCSDFTTQEEAQTYFDAHGGTSEYNFNRLDGDHDGIACESIPSSAGASSADDVFSAKVIRVIDGDTFEVETSNAKYTIRLAEIDCPEKNQSYGDEAKEVTTSLALNKIVTIYKEDTDQYDRLIAKVILSDGLNLNRELIRSGNAWWYDQYSDDLSLKGLETEARNSHLGLWQENNPVAPWAFRNN